MIELEPGDDRQLATALGIKDGEVRRALKGLQGASVREYVDMLLGRHTLHRVDEIRQYRLFLLIQHWIAQLLPDLTDAQRSIHFVRSVPGVACALAGMGDLRNVRENAALRRAPVIEHSVMAALQAALAES